MRVVGFALLGLVGLLALWLGAAFAMQAWHTYLHALRVTVEVETPTGPRSASGVLHVVVSEKSGMLPETDGVLNSVRGEAVFLDLGEGRNLVALLARGPNAEGADPLHDWAPRALGRMREGWYRDAPRWTGVARLRGDLAPALATFADLSDPGSARLVRPTEFGAVFGPGYSFVGALLEMADAGVWPLNVLGFSGDPVTRELARHLPWLARAGSGVRFTTALRASGYRPQSSVEPKTLLVRGQ